MSPVRTVVSAKIVPTSVRIKKGLNIPIAGQPEQVIDSGKAVKHVALLGPDYVGLKPRVLVEAGQVVSLGEPLFLDKRDPQVHFVSPGSGRVVAINRARRRKLQSVVIALDDAAASEAIFDPLQSPDPSDVRDLLLKSGLWTGFRTRPYNRIAHSSSTPRSIFVTAIDTRPLAADPQVIIADRKSEFREGMAAISRLGNWPVYLCTGPQWSGPEFDDDGIRRVDFAGPHPAGLAGTHIHYLDPVAADRLVWHIGYQDVIAIGHLFKTGRLLTERIVSIAGPGALNPRLLRTRPGASVLEVVNGESATDRDCRVISGSLLDGRAALESVGYLGRYHNQISIVPEAVERRRLFGWVTPTTGGLSTANRFVPVRQGEHLHELTTACNGRRAAMIPAEALERVMPLDTLPVPLLRAILVKDTDAAQALGCLELAEEDLALSSFVCPAKLDYGAALRINLDQIEQEG